MAPLNAIPPNGKFRKLLLTVDNKNNYVAHYRILQFYIKQGLKISKVHKILKFQVKVARGIY